MVLTMANVVVSLTMIVLVAAVQAVVSFGALALVEGDAYFGSYAHKRQHSLTAFHAPRLTTVTGSLILVRARAPVRQRL